jgi:hypothetical protein
MASPGHQWLALGLCRFEEASLEGAGISLRPRNQMNSPNVLAEETPGEEETPFWAVNSSSGRQPSLELCSLRLASSEDTRIARLRSQMSSMLHREGLLCWERRLCPVPPRSRRRWKRQQVSARGWCAREPIPSGWGSNSANRHDAQNPPAHPETNCHQNRP